MRKCVLLLLTVAMTGCSWFSWLPWVDKDEESKKLKPAELVKFDAEVRIDRSRRAVKTRGSRSILHTAITSFDMLCSDMAQGKATSYTGGTDHGYGTRH